MSWAEDGSLHCDMTDHCTDPVTHIESKGFGYCTIHAETRRYYGHRVRKLTPAERRKLERGEPVAEY